MTIKDTSPLDIVNFVKLLHYHSSFLFTLLLINHSPGAHSFIKTITCAYPNGTLFRYVWSMYIILTGHQAVKRVKK